MTSLSRHPGCSQRSLDQLKFHHPPGRMINPERRIDLCRQHRIAHLVQTLKTLTGNRRIAGRTHWRHDEYRRGGGTTKKKTAARNHLGKRLKISPLASASDTAP